MRVKLCLDSFQQQQRKKVCFFIGEGTCKKVADLNYLIKKRFFGNGKGSVALFLDGFFIPPEEDIDIVHSNDLLKVQFTAEKQAKQVNEIKNKATANGRDSTDSSSSSSSSSEQELPPKKKLAIANSNKIQGNAANKNTKKVIPISKLGISKRNSSSSSSESSSSQESSDSDENEIVRNKKRPSLIDSNKKTSLKTQKVTAKKDSVTISSDDTSSSSTDSDTKNVDNKESISRTQSASKVDFNISGLAKKGATSTPSINVSSGSTAQSILKNSSDKKRASKDKYKNVSKVFTYTPDTTMDYSSQNSISCNVPASFQDNNISSCQKNNTANGAGDVSLKTLADTNQLQENDNSLNGPSAVNYLHSSSAHTSVSGRTLRNRRRRQRKVAKQREMEEKSGNLSQSKEGKEENQNQKGRSHIVESVGSTLQHIKKFISGEKIVETENQQEIFNKDDACCVIDQDGLRDKTQRNHPKTHLKEDIKPVAQRNYEVLQLIKECPSKGSKIAFKLLEMDEKYQPFVSEYKEAEIVSFHKDSEEVTLKALNGFCIEDKRNGKFEMDENDNDSGDQIQPKLISDQTVLKEWKQLLEPRLIEDKLSHFEF